MSGNKELDDLRAQLQAARLSVQQAELQAQQAEREKAEVVQQAELQAQQAEREKAEVVQQAELQAQQAEREKAEIVQQAEREKAEVVQQAEREKARNYSAALASARACLKELGASEFVAATVVSRLRAVSDTLSASLRTVDSELIDTIKLVSQSAANVESVASSLNTGDGSGEDAPVSYRTDQSVGIAFPDKPPNASSWTDFSKLGTIPANNNQLNLVPYNDVDIDDVAPEWFTSLMAILNSMILLLWVDANVYEDDSGVQTFADLRNSTSSSSSSTTSSASRVRVRPPSERAVQLVIARILQVCGQHFQFDVCDATGGPSLHLHAWAGFVNCKGKTDLLLWFRKRRCLAAMIEVKVALSKGKYLSQFYTSLAAFTCGRNACWSVATLFRNADASTALPLGLLFNGHVMLRAQLRDASTISGDEEFVGASLLWNVFRQLTCASIDTSRPGPMSPGKPTRQRVTDSALGIRQPNADTSNEKASSGSTGSGGKGSGFERGRQATALQRVSFSALNILAHNMDMHGEKLRNMGVDID
jgi:multidrug efflux pump subunit AcrA (membrane-fusion protein)